MRKIAYYGFPILVIAIFIAVMVSGNYLKMPMGKTDHVEFYLKSVRQELMHKNWAKAAAETRKLETAWNKVVPRIQYSIERDEIRYFEVSIARLKGYITAKDNGGALAEINEAHKHWHSLGE